jgi:hypothetical protein
LFGRDATDGLFGRHLFDRSEERVAGQRHGLELNLAR